MNGEKREKKESNQIGESKIPATIVEVRATTKNGFDTKYKKRRWIKICVDKYGGSTVRSM